MKRFLVAVLAVALPSVAAAQDAMVEGPGVKVGESTVLHPRVGFEGGVVSNVFYEALETATSPILRALASLDIASAEEDRLGADLESSARTVEFRGGAALTYQEYLSDNDAIQSQRHLDAEANANLKLFPQSNASFELIDRFQRVNRPTNFESEGSLTRDINHFIGKFNVHPRGRTLSGSIRYENRLDIFESEDSKFADRVQHTLGARTNWKFFPYSQVWLDVSLGFYGALGDNLLAGMTYKVGSNPLRVTAGIDTNITEKTTVNAYAGYANGFYETGPSYNTPVGGLLLGWRYAPFGRVQVGYAHEVADSINANFYQEHHGWLGIAQGVGKVILTGGIGAHLRSYRGIPMQILPVTPEREDFILDANARISWMIKDRFSVYLGGLLQSVDTDFRVMSDSEEASDPSYLRGEAYLGMVAAF